METYKREREREREIGCCCCCYRLRLFLRVWEYYLLACYAVEIIWKGGGMGGSANVTNKKGVFRVTNTCTYN